MKLKCSNCGHEFDGCITSEDSVWYSYCNECLSPFDVDVPKGRIIMAFANDCGDYYDDFFSDDWYDTNEFISYYAFDTPEEFMEKWNKVVDNPDSMWYWVLDNGELICSGACDPGDEEIFEEYFGFEKENKSMTNAEFLNKLNAMFAEIFPKAKGKRTVNELIFVLRQDNEIEDYCLNINSKSKGFSFGFAKQSFFPTRSLALKIDSIEYSEGEDSEYPCIVVKTN